MDIKIGGWQVFSDPEDQTHIVDVVEGLDGLGLVKFAPNPRTDLACLQATLGNYYKPRTKGIKHILRPVKNSVTGYRVVEDTPKAELSPGEMTGPVVATAGWNRGGEFKLDPLDWTIRDAVLEGIEEEKKFLSTGGYSKALIEVLKGRFSAYTMPAKGGAYWVNEEHKDELFRVIALFNGVRTRNGEGQNAKANYVDHLTVVANEGMVRACGRALTRETQQALSEIRRDVEDGDLTEEKCMTRLRRAAEIEGKVKRYEDAFGQPMGELTAAVKDIGVMLAQATIQCTASAFAD